MNKELEEILKEVLIRQHAQAIVTMIHLSNNDDDYFRVLFKGYNALVDEMLRRGDSKTDFDPLPFFKGN